MIFVISFTVRNNGLKKDTSKTLSGDGASRIVGAFPWLGRWCVHHHVAVKGHPFTTEKRKASQWASVSESFIGPSICTTCLYWSCGNGVSNASSFLRSSCAHAGDCFAKPVEACNLCKPVNAIIPSIHTRSPYESCPLTYNLPPFVGFPKMIILKVWRWRSSKTARCLIHLLWGLYI